MRSNVEFTKAMIAYAKKHKLAVPDVSLTPVWGNGKRMLAWRVSGHAFGAKWAATQRTSRMEKLLFPDTSPKPHIEYPVYNWKGNHSYVGKHPGIVWHHAAGYGSAQQIHQIHLSIGDRGIAYHFYVRTDGTIYAGRPLGTWGAHCLGHNDWIGICAEGNYDVKYMPPKQQAAMRELHNWLHKKYGGIPDKQHKYMSGNSTACPGRHYPFKAITS